MKRLPTLFTLVLFTAFLAQPPALAQDRGNEEPRVSPNAAVSQTIGTTEVRIAYGRPSVRERDIFGGLVPHDSTWRTGANEATTITFSSDVEVEGRPLEAGTYSLFTIPAREAWTIIFNTNPGQWGDFSYDRSTDALRVQVNPEEAPMHEMMTFVFEEVSEDAGELVLYWDETRAPISVAVD